MPKYHPSSPIFRVIKILLKEENIIPKHAVLHLLFYCICFSYCVTNISQEVYTSITCESSNTYCVMLRQTAVRPLSCFIVRYLETKVEKIQMADIIWVIFFTVE